MRSRGARLGHQWIQSYACKTKTSQETDRSLRKFLKLPEQPKVIYITVRWNLVNLVKIYHEIIVLLTSHRSETNGFAERAVRRIKERTSAALLQSGLDEKQRAASMKYCCYLRNVQDFLEDGKTP